MILLFYINAISVTIQSPIRKTAAVQLLFAHAVTSPHKLCQMFLRMQAFDVHIAIICTALNSCKSFRYALYYRIYFENSRGDNNRISSVRNPCTLPRSTVFVKIFLFSCVGTATFT